MSPSSLTRPRRTGHDDQFRHWRRQHDADRPQLREAMTITHTLARTDNPWHRLDVRHWDALAHTSVNVLGILDMQAIEAIDSAVRTADSQRHTLSLELQQISSVTPEALESLLAPHSGRRTAARLHVAGMCADQIRCALDEDRFVLYWQPIIELATDTATHHEVLLRMIGIDGEVIAPAAFIETAERFGLIAELDRWVVRTAIQHLAEDRDSAYRLEINLSGHSFGDPQLPELIEREIAATGVDPGRLVFEITETAAIENMDHACASAERLRRLGCRLGLDDFGAGFSPAAWA
jgi:sensor c-di-GMP phosphodiesterase-like protein